MRQFYIFAFLFLTFSSLFSQEKEEKTNGIFYKLSLASTLAINKEYTLDEDDDTGPLLNPSALFVNNTLGYQFDKKASIGLNFEYNWHSQQGLHFAPAFLSFQYNIIGKENPLFLRGGYGTLLGLGKSFEKGNMYRIGTGFRVYNEDYIDSFLLGLDFTRKRFGYKTLEGLSSVSIFLEYMFF